MRHAAGYGGKSVPAQEAAGRKGGRRGCEGRTRWLARGSRQPDSLAISASNQARSLARSAWSGEASRSRAMMARPSRNPASARSDSPWSASMRARRPWLTERSRCQPALPGSACGQTLADRERGAVGLQRRREVALRAQHVADLVVRHRQVALPAGVAGIGLRQALGDGERGAVAVAAPPPGCPAPPARRRSCCARPTGRAASRRCRDRPAPGARRWRATRGSSRSAGAEVALRDQHVADPVVRDREVALPAGVAGIGLRQALSDGERGAVAAVRRRRDCPAPPARRRSCRARPTGRAASRRCRDRRRRGARRSRARRGSCPAPRRDRPAPQHVADPVVRHRQVALPAGVAGVGRRQALSDGREAR